MSGMNAFEEQVRDTPGRTFRFIHHSEMTIKRPDWIVRGYLEKDSFAQFFGDPSFGKTLGAVDLACCVATGRNFHGIKVHQYGVLFIAGEGMNGLTRRIRAWEIENSTSLADAPLYFSTGAAAFTDAGSLEQIRAAMAALPEGVNIGLVIIDTLARNFGPGDENLTKDMNVFISALDSIRADYFCAILPVHHSGHGDKTRGRGAMALKGALDAEYVFTKDIDGIVRMTCTKMKDFDIPEPLAFRIKGVDLGMCDEDGDPVTGAVLVRTEYTPPAKKRQAKGKNQTSALATLEGMLADYPDEQWTYADCGSRVSVGDWRTECEKTGMIRQRFNDAKNGLLNNGLIEIISNYVAVL